MIWLTKVYITSTQYHLGAVETVPDYPAIKVAMEAVEHYSVGDVFGVRVKPLPGHGESDMGWAKFKIGTEIQPVENIDGSESD